MSHLKSWSLQRISEGQRLIDLVVAHMQNGKKGFISDVLLTYILNQEASDYHHNMTFDIYYSWLKETLRPNLPPRSVLFT